jgi:hypothetical protein
VVEFVEHAGDGVPHLRARATAMLAEAHFAAFDFESGLAQACNARALAEIAGDDRVLSEVLFAEALQHQGRFELDESDRCLAESIAHGASERTRCRPHGLSRGCHRHAGCAATSHAPRPQRSMPRPPPHIGRIGPSCRSSPPGGQPSRSRRDGSQMPWTWRGGRSPSIDDVTTRSPPWSPNPPERLPGPCSVTWRERTGT